jgi:LmbE family N-acetylglucosaminyl deacetylase
MVNDSKIFGDVVAVMAHPDDAELWAGGTLALHAQTSKVTILVATSDEVRKVEALSGASVLGAEVKIVTYHTLQDCACVLSSLRPEVVVTHRMDDVHSDHRDVAELVLRALPEVVIATGFPRRVYTCDTYESLTLHGKVEGRVIVDVTSTFDQKLEALSTHRSQPLKHFMGMARRLGELWGARCGCQWAEAFDPVPILGRLPSCNHL